MIIVRKTLNGYRAETIYDMDLQMDCIRLQGQMATIHILILIKRFLRIKAMRDMLSGDNDAISEEQI